MCDRTCLRCGRLPDKIVRGYCHSCYRKERYEGRIEIINGRNGVNAHNASSTCGDCGGPPVGKLIKGMCRTCYYRRYKGVQQPRNTKCRRCRKVLGDGAKWSLCPTCQNYKEGHKPDHVTERIKILVVKWKWGYLLPWEHLEICSLWVDWFSTHVGERGLDAKPVNLQIEMMIADFKRDLENNI